MSLLSSFVFPLLQAAAPQPSPPYPGLLGQLSVPEQLLFFLIVIVFFAGCFSLLNLSFTFMEIQRLRLTEQISQGASPEQLEPVKPFWRQLYDRLTDNIPLEKEEDILLDHNYDGVRELDNNLPPWWKGVFYISMAFAPIYIYFAHFSDYAQSSAEAYVQEMEIAEAEVAAYVATLEDAVDENNVVALTDTDALGKGEIIYGAKCAPCHGKVGEGGIGPNLTDRYWIHGGAIGDIFRTIKNGVPEKGMIPWKNELRPRDIQEVASFIASLEGSAPPNAKEPEGTLLAGTNSK